MDSKKKQGFMDMIHKKLGPNHELVPIIAMLASMAEEDDRFEDMFDVYQGVEEYGQYLTEKEAKRIVSEFIAYDGTHGAKWSPEVLFKTVEDLGGEKSAPGKYNCWALYVLMNMMHSDYGGALSPSLSGNVYPLTCYRMALAWMKDKDNDNNVRDYFLS